MPPSDGDALSHPKRQPGCFVQRAEEHKSAEKKANPPPDMLFDPCASFIRWTAARFLLTRASAGVSTPSSVAPPMRCRTIP
jgi:hypothetical protein